MPAMAVLLVATLAVRVVGQVAGTSTVLSSRGQSSNAPGRDPGAGPAIDFVLGTATPSEVCAQCHEAIYREVAFGFESDLEFKPIINQSLGEPLLAIPSRFPNTGTAHYLAGVDPWPIRAREVENGGDSCNVCHYPQPFTIPDINIPVIESPVPRARNLEDVGVTCASCHLTPGGAIRGSYGVAAPHQSVAEPAIRTSAMCAYCHARGQRVVGKQTQTFYEWRDDFNKAGLGPQHCQDCHMPRTVQVLAEGYNVPPRVVGSHLWTGDHSTARILEGLKIAVVSDPEGEPAGSLQFRVRNAGAGHSVPTGSNRRAVYLTANVIDDRGAVVATKEWMFAPWYGNRPDDRAFLDADQSLPDAIAAIQADAQGPHEAPIRAGEDRVLSWAPSLRPGTYEVRTTLTYDLNRYNDRRFLDDQTETARYALVLRVP